MIAGWMMRMIEDMPILPPGLLNQGYPGLFRPDEAVTICPAEMSTEEMLRLWEVMLTTGYQLSAPYVARFVRVDSLLPVETGLPIQERRFDLAVPVDAP
jgi:hypothetical protein